MVLDRLLSQTNSNVLGQMVTPKPTICLHGWPLNWLLAAHLGFRVIVRGKVWDLVNISRISRTCDFYFR